MAGRPSSTVISRGGRRPPQNHSDPQRKRGSGGRPGLEGRRAREAVGADRRRAAAGQEGEGLRPARPRAQLGEERPPQRSARSPGPRPRRPPRIRERRGEHRGGGSRFSQAGGRRLSGGRAPRPGPGGGVAVSAERNRARGPTVLKKKSKNRPERAPRAALGRLPGLGAPAPLKWAARVSAAVTYAPATLARPQRSPRERRISWGRGPGRDITTDVDGGAGPGAGQGRGHDGALARAALGTSGRGGGSGWLKQGSGKRCGAAASVGLQNSSQSCLSGAFFTLSFLP